MTDKEKEESFKRFLHRMETSCYVTIPQCEDCIFKKYHDPHTMYGCIKRDPNKQPPTEILSNDVKCEFRKTK